MTVTATNNPVLTRKGAFALKIPDAALQQHIAVLGKTGSGKTFAAKAAIVEPLLELGRRVAIVDPTGAWWGLRSSRDGKREGFKVLVLGGDHADLPLPPASGAAIARLVTEQGINVVADTSLLHVGERNRWFLEFASALYRGNRAPLHLVLDEAHNFAPQGGGGVRDVDVGKMLHAANTLASGGRSRGIRLTLITQRPQKLHKDALTSADTLIAMRVLAPQDRAAVEDWIKGCGDIAQGKDVLNSLAKLQRGEGWVWYPEGGHLERVRFPAIKTFDSSATPTDHGAAPAPTAAAAMDMAEIRALLENALAEAEADDPKLLHQRIAELEQQLQDGVQPDEELVEVARKEGYAAGLAATKPLFERLTTLSAGIAEALQGAREDIDRLGNSRVSPAQRAARSPAPEISDDTGDLPKGEHRVLTAIAQHGEGVSREQLTVLTGYKRSTRDAYIQRLRERGLVEDRGRVTATAAGLAALGPNFKPLPTGKALLEHWMQRLPEGERKVLDIVVRAWPSAADREEISKATGYARSSRDAYLQRLGARQLVIPERGGVRASDTLFNSRR